MFLLQCDNCGGTTIPLQRADGAPQLPEHWIRNRLSVTTARRLTTHFCSLACIKVFDADRFIKEHRSQKKLAVEIENKLIECVPAKRRKKAHRSEPKLYISFMPEGNSGPRIDKGSVPLDVDIVAHIASRADCPAGIYRIEKKRSGEFAGEVQFIEKEKAAA